MIRFAIDAPHEGPGYVLVAEVDHEEYVQPIRSEALIDERSVALQARQLADAAASLIENVPEHAAAFERLHDALDLLPSEGA